MGVLIQSIVIEVLEAQEGQGASLLGADHPPDHTQGQGHEVSRHHAHSLGLHLLGLTHQSTVMVPSTVGHLHILLLAVMMEDKPRLDPAGKKVSLQRKDTTATLKRHFIVNMSKAERSFHVTESIVKADHH